MVEVCAEETGRNATAPTLDAQRGEESETQAKQSNVSPKTSALQPLQVQISLRTIKGKKKEEKKKKRQRVRALQSCWWNFRL